MTDKNKPQPLNYRFLVCDRHMNNVKLLNMFVSAQPFPLTEVYKFNIITDYKNKLKKGITHQMDTIQSEINILLITINISKLYVDML